MPKPLPTALLWLPKAFVLLHLLQSKVARWPLRSGEMSVSLTVPMRALAVMAARLTRTPMQRSVAMSETSGKCDQ